MGEKPGHQEPAVKPPARKPPNKPVLSPVEGFGGEIFRFVLAKHYWLVLECLGRTEEDVSGAYPNGLLILRSDLRIRRRFLSEGFS